MDRVSTGSKRAPLFLLALDEDPVQCDVMQQRKVFPNLDFALMGYHILKGFPLTSGTDSGLTKPIFQVNSLFIVLLPISRSHSFCSGFTLVSQV